MTIVTIVVEDQTNPVEVQTWFNNNPLMAITAVMVAGNIFYIVHA